MMHTVTCNGRPIKVSPSESSCRSFVAMQLAKTKSGGIAPAYAAGCQWDIRQHKYGDERELLRGYVLPSTCTPDMCKVLGIRTQGDR